jgi:hypothetical protein
MRPLVGVLGALLIMLMLLEFFVTFLLPRRVKRDPRIARRALSLLWRPWRAFAARLHPVAADTVLGFFGPLALLFLIAFWTLGIMLGFSCLHWANGTQLIGEHGRGFFQYLYLSGGSFLSASSGLEPAGSWGHTLLLLEAAAGFAVLFIAIGYMPPLYQAFSAREVAVSQLDPRAGSPPSAGKLLVRSSRGKTWDELDGYLDEWDTWAAELMETHLAYPILAYFRSQHVSQNWLAALTTILDACAFRIAASEQPIPGSAERTLAIGRHALSDLAFMFQARPGPDVGDRLDGESFERLYALVSETGLRIESPDRVRVRLDEGRATYEQHAQALANRLALTLPSWLPDDGPRLTEPVHTPRPRFRAPLS